MNDFFCFDEDGKWFVDVGGLGKHLLGPFDSFEAANAAYQNGRGVS